MKPIRISNRIPLVGGATLGEFLIVAVIIGIVFMILGSSFIGCDATYSEGYRDGVVEKFSHKGILIKSWEGDLAQHHMPYNGEFVFKFSVDDENIVQQIQNLPYGAHVRLHYRQVLKNASRFHETDYRIVRVEILSPPK